MKAGIHPIILCALFCFVSAPVPAGVYFGSSSTIFEPFIVVHPAGYDGTGGPVPVRICIGPNSSTTLPPLIAAIEIWNGLVASTSNCEECFLLEEPPPGIDAPPSMTTTLIHELGHCAMGLDEINWQATLTSFTNNQDAVSVDDGADDVRGSRDDAPSPLPGTRVVHWFRIADNDPFVIDATVIDMDTYSRRIIDFPAGSTWPESGNRGVGDHRGLTDTQSVISVMYGAIRTPTRYLGLTADDVNTVKYGMTGLDENAGTTDDYTIELIYEPDCSAANIEVRLAPLAPTELGACTADLEPLPTGGSWCITRWFLSLVSRDYFSKSTPTRTGTSRSQTVSRAAIRRNGRMCSHSRAGPADDDRCCEGRVVAPLSAGGCGGWEGEDNVHFLAWAAIMQGRSEAAVAAARRHLGDRRRPRHTRGADRLQPRRQAAAKCRSLRVRETRGLGTATRGPGPGTPQEPLAPDSGPGPGTPGAGDRRPGFHPRVLGVRDQPVLATRGSGPAQPPPDPGPGPGRNDPPGPGPG